MHAGGWSHEQDGEGFGVGSGVQRDDNGVADGRLAAEGRFEVLGINVESGGRDDDIFLSAAKAQIPFCVEFAEIAGAEPAIVFRHA